VGLESLPLALAVLIGSGGMLLSAVRTLAAFLQVREENPEIKPETRYERAALVFGVFFLVFIGIAPQIILDQATSLLNAFSQLVW
jgi:formate hydrogenlyase subunit 3/multisubunit Na+/H+ antiporter MnhD subunit